MNDISVKVTGIRELQRALRQVSDEAPRELRDEFRKLAERIAGKVADRVPHVSGRAAGSVKPRATQRGASIAVGGQAAPYYPWLDFGGSVGRGHRPGISWSGAVKRMAQDGGRYLYPTLRDENESIRKDLDQVLGRLASKAGFETHEG